MSRTLKQIIELVQRGEVRVSLHGYDELAADDILVHEAVDGISDAVVVEDYPDYYKGPAVLVLQKDYEGEAIHVLWGVAKDSLSPAVLVTAYRPDPERWRDGFTRRR